MPTPNKSPAPLQKEPGTIRLYSVNFGNQPELRDSGEMLTGPAVSASPAGLTLGTPAVSGARVQFAVAGGADATDYDILVTVTTSGGAFFSKTVTLQVRTKP